MMSFYRQGEAVSDKGGVSLISHGGIVIFVKIFGEKLRRIGNFRGRNELVFNPNL